MTKRTLYYFYDPMCSWCYGFKTTLQKLKTALPKDIKFIPVLGGLAPDSTQPMSEDTKTMVKGAWHSIMKHIPEAEFNFDYWEQCQPLRSTYPACRAVLCAKQESDALGYKMIEQIQLAYYQQAKNPSLVDTLAQCAKTIGMDAAQFKIDIVSDATEQLLQNELAFCKTMNVSSYPTLKLSLDNSHWAIAIDYNDFKIILKEIEIVSRL